MMQTWQRGASPQHLVGVGLVGLLLLELGAAWLVQGPQALPLEQVALALGLALGVIAASRFPLVLGLRHQVVLRTLPLYLLAALISSPVLAIMTAGGSLLVADLLVPVGRPVAVRPALIRAEA